MHRAFGQVRDGAIARVIQQQVAFIRLAAIDVARMRDDAEHRGIGERVHGDALEPAPAAVPVPEAVFESIEFGLVRRLRREDDAEALAHRGGHRDAGSPSRSGLTTLRPRSRVDAPPLRSRR